MSAEQDDGTKDKEGEEVEEEQVGDWEGCLSGTLHFFVTCTPEEWKFATLCDLLAEGSFGQSVIYCNTRRKAEWLTQRLEKDGFTVSCLHASLEPDAWQRALHEFRDARTHLLVATNSFSFTRPGGHTVVAGLVVLYDVPRRKEHYLHRLKRTGKFRNRMLAISFTTTQDHPTLLALANHYGITINELPHDFATFL